LTAWLAKTTARREALESLGNQLLSFLTARIKSPDDALSFRDALPIALSHCSESGVFEKAFVPEAYAHLHMLRRYWRVWSSLDALRQEALLPLGVHGVNSLDIGSGPAMGPYAIQDYYAKLAEYGRSQCRRLAAQSATTDVVEASPGMIRFFHHFSEFTRRPGPFGPMSPEFSHLDLQELRRVQY